MRIQTPTVILGGKQEELQKLHDALPPGMSYLTTGSYKGEQESSLIVNVTADTAASVLDYYVLNDQESLLRLDRDQSGKLLGYLVNLQENKEQYLGVFKRVAPTLLGTVDGWVKFKGNYYCAR